jgi:hypothetical protein
MSGVSDGAAARALKKLYGRMRTESWKPPAQSGSVRRLVSRDGTRESGHLALTESQEIAFQGAVSAVGDDLRFEHLGKGVEEAVWHFACLSKTETLEAARSAFRERYAKEPVLLTCFFPILYLRVSKEAEVFGVRLLPKAHADAPQSSLAPPGDEMRGGFVAVLARGTEGGRVAARARMEADRALRRLRVALFRHHSIDEIQLRFRLGESYAFSTGGHGWRRRADDALELGLGEDLLTFIDSQPVSTSFPRAGSPLAAELDVAMEWLDAGAFTGVPLHSLLFYFFALEALLGDRAEGLKAPALALRAAMLSHLETGGFRHPSETFWLYDEVRSVAVHGGAAPELDSKTARSFGYFVRRTFNEFLSFCEKNSVTRRSQALKVLDTHPDRKDLLDWLVGQARPEWKPFLAAQGYPAAPMPEGTERGS